jgi:hypothetical protein
MSEISEISSGYAAYFPSIDFNGERDKYIGLALAISSSLAIGTSFIITKKVAFPFQIISLTPRLIPVDDFWMNP